MITPRERYFRSGREKKRRVYDDVRNASEIVLLAEGVRIKKKKKNEHETYRKQKNTVRRTSNAIAANKRA